MANQIVSLATVINNAVNAVTPGPVTPPLSVTGITSQTPGISSNHSSNQTVSTSKPT